MGEPPVEPEHAGREPGGRWGAWLCGAAVAGLAILAVAVALGLLELPRHELVPGDGEQEARFHHGIWSILPPVIAILLAFLTRNVIVALFVGIVVGGVVSGQINVVEAYLIPSIGSADYALILLVYLWALGGLIGLWTRTGGATHFAEWAGRLMVRGPRSAKLFAWLMGLVFHQGGTISTVLTGATVRSAADRQRVSHEELSYVVDSTASPAATLIPFNVWPIYVGGLVVGTIPLFEREEDAIAFFFQSVPFNFYAIFAVALTLLLALERLPWVPPGMARATRRARETGKLDREGAVPLTSAELSRLEVPAGYRPGLVDFFGPIGTLLAVAIIPFTLTYFWAEPIDRWLQGRGWLEEGQWDRSPILLIGEAFLLAVLVGIGVALIRGMRLGTAIEGFVGGCKGVTIGAIILALAVTLKSVADSVGTADYVIETVGGVITPLLLPALLVGICMFIAFSTGTSFGTFAVVFPVAMPLAWAVMDEPFFITLCFSAVIGGSLFGDQCSPISDTTILSSLGTGADLMDHVYTQLPLALIAAGGAALLYTLLALTFLS